MQDKVKGVDQQKDREYLFLEGAIIDSQLESLLTYKFKVCSNANTLLSCFSADKLNLPIQLISQVNNVDMK